jgi:dephospho-CoA kinase
VNDAAASAGSRPFRVGLTGGIASGKSTVADFFAELGVPVVDTDQIARQVVAIDSPALEEIRTTFGPDVIAADGTLDRAAMRKIVFADDGKRRILESILHPRIRELAFRHADQASAPYVIIVVPLLFESPMRNAMNRILVVDCTVETQLQRLLARDCETEEQAKKIIAAQATRDERLSIADDVIANDSDLEATRREVGRLHRRYLALAARGS